MFKEKVKLFRAKITKIQSLLLWLVTIYFAETFIRNGIRKFDMDGFWASPFEKWGYPMWFMVFIGILETLGGISLLIPKLRHYGAFVISIVMTGALATRLINGVGFNDAFYISFVIITMLYLTTNLNHNSE